MESTSRLRRIYTWNCCSKRYDVKLKNTTDPLSVDSDIRIGAVTQRWRWNKDIIRDVEIPYLRDIVFHVGSDIVGSTESIIEDLYHQMHVVKPARRKAFDLLKSRGYGHYGSVHDALNVELRQIYDDNYKEFGLRKSNNNNNNNNDDIVCKWDVMRDVELEYLRKTVISDLFDILYDIDSIVGCVLWHKDSIRIARNKLNKLIGSKGFVNVSIDEMRECYCYVMNKPNNLH